MVAQAVLFKTSKQESFTAWEMEAMGLKNGHQSPDVDKAQPAHRIGDPFSLGFEHQRLCPVFHNPYEARIDIETNGLLKYMAEDGNIDFYFIYGPSMDDLIKNYYEITGYPPMILSGHLATSNQRAISSTPRKSWI